jgi:alkaline phosphatase D
MDNYARFLGRHRSRRELMRHALVTAAALTTLPSFAGAQSTARFKTNPFALLGVASGDPTPTSVVLWCRLALDLADVERWGLDSDTYRVEWEVRPAEQRSARPVRSGSALASRDKGYAVHVEAGGLQPGRPYEYTFRFAGFSASGRTRTAPSAHVVADRLRFCFCSCAEYENELYFGYDEMAKEAPDLIIHLGDYIYEETYDRFFKSGSDHRARRLKFDRETPLTTLAQYRRRYAEHKTDPMLQRAHAAAPWVVTWDDHEVANDFAGGSKQDLDDRAFVERMVAAYRAYFENMPIRLSSLPVRDGRRQLYRRLDFGRLMRLYMLDERQYRDPQACRAAKWPAGKNVPLADCPEIEASQRSVLGDQQERWLVESLNGSQARWNVLAQGVMFAHLEARQDPKAGGRTDPHVWTDAWSGYLPARQRIIDLLSKHRSKGPVVLSGDVHAHFVNRIWRDWRKPGDDFVAPEFVTASVSSFARELAPLVADPANKEIVAYHTGVNGYVSCEVTPKSLQATMVRLLDKNRANGTARADRSVRYVVEHGDGQPRREQV